MSKGTFKISEEILIQVKHLAEESGMSKEDFVHCLAKFYDVNDSIDCNCYYDSFTAQFLALILTTIYPKDGNYLNQSS